MTHYDKNNIFAKILRGEIPCKSVYEDEFALAFHDINPAAKLHILVIPKGEYISFDDFATHAPADLQTGFYKAVQAVAKQSGLIESGYRLISNHGKDSGQEVPHYHVHVLGGQAVGPLVAA